MSGKLRHPRGGTEALRGLSIDMLTPMGRHLATVEIRCPNCGARAAWVYIAEPKGHVLRFSGSFRCASCSSAMEIDGPELVEEARRAFLAAEGRWSLHVRDLGPRPVETLRVLRAALPDTPSAIMRIVRVRRPVAEGALVELEGLEGMLREAGADVGLTRLPD